jgi:hypothetical protein
MQASSYSHTRVWWPPLPHAHEPSHDLLEEVVNERPEFFLERLTDVVEEEQVGGRHGGSLSNLALSV